MAVLNETKTWSNTKSLEIQKRALRVTTQGQTNLRAALKVMDKPLFFVKAKGSRMWDVDGNEYVDFSNSAGPSILGHSNSEYIQAIKDQLDTFYTLTTGMCQTMMEVELAEKIVQHVPCAEKVRFSITGSDAVQLAVRLARAYTKRPYFIRFEGHYHGWLDNVLGGLVNPNVPERPWPVESEEDVFGTAGRAPEVFNQSMMLPWNDVEVLEATLKKYGDQVAMIHMEPILCNGECCHALPGYLKKVRQLCDQYGIVMSFDEVITGFRVGLGGAQELLGVTPDIATFGKALSGGAMPVSAVAGKSEILDLLDQGEVVGAGTFNGYPLGLAAALATVKILEKDNGAIYRRIDASQKRLTDGLKELMANKGVPFLIQQARGIFYTLFSKKKEAHSVRDLDDMDVGKQMKLFYKMAEEGIILMLAGRWYVSGAIDDADVDRALEAMERVLPKL